MADSSATFQQLGSAAKNLGRRVLTLGQNRLELFAVEVQEERERLLQALLLALGVAAFGLLASLTLTTAIVVLLWAYSPVVVLLLLTGLYGVAAALICRQLALLMRDWQTLSATRDQLRKDRASLEALVL